MLGAISMVLLVCFTSSAGASTNIHGYFEGYPIVRILVNGEIVESDVPAINFHGRTLVPIRFVSEALGAEVGWDPQQWVASVELEAASAPVFAPSTTPSTGGVAVIAPSISTMSLANQILSEAGVSPVTPKQADEVLVVVRSSLFNPLQYSYSFYGDLYNAADRQLNISGPKYHVYLYSIGLDLNVFQMAHESIEASDIDGW